MNRRTFLTQCSMTTAGLTTLLQGCQPLNTRGALASDAKGLGASTATDTTHLEQPAIDLVAPSIIETATFAMG